MSKIPILIAIYLSCIQKLSGINAISIYGGDIVSKTASKTLSDLIPSILNFEQVLGNIFAGLLLIKLGRKTILQFGLLSVTISNLLASIGFGLQYMSEYNSTVSLVFILIGLIIFMMTFSLSLGPIIWLYIP